MKGFKSFPLRVAAMLTVMAVVAVGYFTTTGIGNSCAIGFSDISLICPLGALLAIIAQKTAIPMAVVSVVAVLAICLVLGKVFCAWLCPVGFLAPKRTLAECLSRRGKSSAAAASCQAGCSGCSGKGTGIRLDGRHVVLAAAVVSTLVFGFPVFCLACPVGLTFSTVLLVMQLFAFGKTTWTVIVFPLIVFVELFVLPRWCHHLCPLGALLSLFSAGNRTLRPVVDAQRCVQTAEGKSCGLCAAVCPEGIKLHDLKAGRASLNDCSRCRACADVCPTGAISFPLVAPKEQAGGCAGCTGCESSSASGTSSCGGQG